MKKLALKIWEAMCTFFASVRWQRTQAVINGGIYYKLTEQDLDTIRAILKGDYLLIFTRRKCHLTTYLISLISMFASHKSAHYAHVLMNVEGDLKEQVGYKLIEATNSGVHFSTFMQVFDCDSVALLKPRGIELAEWTVTLDYAKNQLGKPYDDLFQLANDNQLSCVELVYWGLKQLPDYEARFPKLVALLNVPNPRLTPQELYDTGEFDIVFEIRR